MCGEKEASGKGASSQMAGLLGERQTQDPETLRQVTRKDLIVESIIKSSILVSVPRCAYWCAW